MSAGRAGQGRRPPCLRIRVLLAMRASLRVAAERVQVTEAQLVRLGIRLVLEALGRDDRPPEARVGLPPVLAELAREMPRAASRRGLGPGRRRRREPRSES